jgi:hypothetical protein
MAKKEKAKPIFLVLESLNDPEETEARVEQVFNVVFKEIFKEESL